MKKKLLNGRQLSRHWENMQASQPQPGPGYLSRGGPQGQTFHQTVFRVGMIPPTGEEWAALTDAQRAGYDEVNVHRPWIVADGKHSSMCPNPGNVLQSKRWPANKGIIVGSRTARMMREAAKSSELSTFEGMLASGTHGGAKLIGQDGLASCQAVHRRGPATASRHARADAGGMAAAYHPRHITAGSNLESRRTPRGTVISATRPNYIQVSWASINGLSIAYNEDAEIRADYDDSGTTIHTTGSFYVLPFCYVPNGIEPGWVMKQDIFGNRVITGMIVLIRHQTPTVDELWQYAVPPVFNEGLNFADPSTWPLVDTFTTEARSTQLFESFTIYATNWA